MNSNTGFPYNQLSEAAKSAINTKESGSPPFSSFSLMRCPVFSFGTANLFHFNSKDMLRQVRRAPEFREGAKYLAEMMSIFILEHTDLFNIIYFLPPPPLPFLLRDYSFLQESVILTPM